MYLSGIKEPPIIPVIHGNVTLESVVDLCVDNIVQYIGIDAKSMLEVMKYEYRFGSLEDIEDLYNKVKDARLPYPLIPYTDVWQAYDNGIFDERKERTPIPKSLALDLYTNGNPDTQIFSLDGTLESMDK
jgi:hypothetical protein